MYLVKEMKNYTCTSLVTLISGVSSKEVTEMGLLQAYFRTSEVSKGFYGIVRSGANYI